MVIDTCRLTAVVPELIAKATIDVHGKLRRRHRHILRRCWSASLAERESGYSDQQA
jgi:hypothetical protein